MWRTSKQASGCRQLSSKPEIKSYRSNGKPASGVGHEEIINRLFSVAGAIAMLRHLRFVSTKRPLCDSTRSWMLMTVPLLVVCCCGVAQ